MNKFTADMVWAGTELSLNEYLHARELSLSPDTDLSELKGAVTLSSGVSDSSPLLTKHGSIGVVSVRGPLTNSDNPFLAFFGVTSYNSIREALIQAAQDSSIKAILMDIDSGGGSVNGVADVGNLIHTIDTSVKPVYSYTDGTMASAAYWLGSSARQVFASKVSTVGSIGAIVTHKESSQALRTAGVNVTVMRAGKYKALANSVEPLTQEAKDQVQTALDAAYKVFVDHVAASRGQTYANVDANMAQGREFFGAAAEAAGLVDGIMSFDQVLSYIDKKIVDSQKNSLDNRGNYSRGTEMGKKALTEQDISAMAAGAGISADATDATDAGDTDASAKSEADVAAAADAAAESSAGAEGAGDSNGTDVSAKAESGQAGADSSDGAVVSYLRGELKDRDERLMAQGIELRDLQKKVGDIEATHNSLVDIARASARNMQIALGGSASDFTDVSVDSLLAEHKRLSGEFSSKFKVGGVAAVDAAASSDAAPVVMDSKRAAILAATRYKK